MLKINRNGCILDNDVLALLERIASFEYPILSGCSEYKTLGDIHNTVNVELTDKRMEKRETIHIVMGRLRDKVAELEEEERAAQEKIKNISRLRYQRMELRSEYSEGDDLSKAMNEAEIEYGKISAQLRTWKNVAESNKNEPDDKEVSASVPIVILGEYIRPKVGDTPTIVLYNQNDKYRMAETYIHELFHAFYDKDHSILNNYIEKVEEPLTEFAMLHFVESYIAVHPEDSEILNVAYNNVKEKKESLGIAHYGFGASIYDAYRNNANSCQWEVKLRNSKPSIDPCSDSVRLFGNFFANSYPYGQDVPCTQLLEFIIR